MIRTDDYEMKKYLHSVSGYCIILFADLVSDLLNCDFIQASLAQLAEHLTLNQGVQGSNP